MDNESGEQEEAYTAAVDMWALGEIVYRCLTQKPAFPSRRDMYLFVTNQKPLNEEPLLRRGTTEPCRDFVKGLLAAIPGERYNADAAASHNWVKLPGIVVEPASPSLKR
jgi:serine/threonine protein kinase